MSTYLDGLPGTEEFKREVDLFLVNSPLDVNQKTYVVKLLIEAYRQGYTDIIVAVKEERERADASSTSFMDQFIKQLNDNKGDN